MKSQGKSTTFLIALATALFAERRDTGNVITIAPGLGPDPRFLHLPKSANACRLPRHSGVPAARRAARKRRRIRARLPK